MDSSPTYGIAYDPKALKELGKLDKPTARRIIDTTSKLAGDPRPVGARQLVGYQSLWRIRIGDYRVVYAINDTEVVVLVLRVAHRSNVYRNL